MLPSPRVMLITDKAQAALPLEDVITQSLQAGCRWVLLRDHDSAYDAFLKQAQRIKKICVAHNAKLFVSRNVNVAKEIQADGVHLSTSQNVGHTRKLCGTMLIGQSCHSIEDVARAQAANADYVTFSPVFDTASKPGYVGMGLKTLEQVCGTTRLPVIALAGIDAQNAVSCLTAGAAGIAVMGNIMRSKTPQATMGAILSAAAAT